MKGEAMGYLYSERGDVLWEKYAEMERKERENLNTAGDCPEGGLHEEEGEENVPRYPIDGTDIRCRKCGTWMRNIPWKGGY